VSGITTGIGIFSGIDTATLIQRLLQIEARPRNLAAVRLVQLQTQQAAILDISNRLSSLSTAAKVFRDAKTFRSVAATSSNETVLTATATTAAVPGSYTFIVDRLVSTQQLLSKGFANTSDAALGAAAFTFEGVEARLDRDTALSDLNGGSGVARGKIVITQSGAGSGSATIDLSRAASVSDVINSINTAEGIDVTASVSGGHFVIAADTPGVLISISNGDANGTAASLGFGAVIGTPAATLTGADVFTLSADTPLSALNDGNGVALSGQVKGPFTSPVDLRIVVDGDVVGIHLGEVQDADGKTTQTASTTLGHVIDRINAALADKGYADVTVGVGPSGTGLVLSGAGRTLEVRENALTDATTAADLGFAVDTPAADSISGSAILAGLNSTLIKHLNGGSGVSAGTMSLTLRDGSGFNAAIGSGGSISDVIAVIEAASDAGSGPRVRITLDASGTGLVLTDLTGGTGNLVIEGPPAASLKIETGPAGVASSTVSSGNLQHQYIRLSTLLSSLNNGQGVGTGTFRITDSTGATDIVDVGDDSRTIEDIIDEINSRNTRIRARLNDRGDGVLLYEPDDGLAGTLAIRVEDVTGIVAQRLNIAREAEGAGSDNVIDGSFERVVEFELSDTLAAVVDKINKAGVGVTATILNDGTGSRPFHLSLTSQFSGVAGRFIVETGGIDLGIQTLDAGENARVFFGSSDPASAVLLSGSSNTITEVVTGVTINLKSAGEKPVELTLSRDTEAIEKTIDEFVSAFNTLVERIGFQTRFVQETSERGPLIGDSTMLLLRSALFNTLHAPPVGVVSAFNSLAQVGLSTGQGGKLAFDREAFQAALRTDPQGVEDLFAAYVLDQPTKEILPGITSNDPGSGDTFSSLGMMGRFEQLVKQYTDSIDGVLTAKDEALSTQVRLQEARIAAFDERLEQRRQILQAQFLAMEQAIASLQTQQAALAGLSALLPR
jgi:flagellar hook-associated protein 2